MMKSGTAFGRKGIKADCNHLIEHTVRNVEHCVPTLASGLLIRFSYLFIGFYILQMISVCNQCIERTD